MDCTWSEWEVLEGCNCETGNKKLSRFQIKEQFGGKPCTGDSIMVEPCDEDELPGKFAFYSIKSFCLWIIMFLNFIKTTKSKVFELYKNR